MELIKTQDGSNTLYSAKYNQHYHNVDDGAINEALSKHIIPTFEFQKDKDELNILDICFGLGYNTFSTIYYARKNNLNQKLNIYSPELDGDLVRSLEHFEFPSEFEDMEHIIKTLALENKYEDDSLKIEINIGDAREYIKSFDENFFDIVYQDAFSSEVNNELWTKEYFDDINTICKTDCVMSTYAIATPIRLSMYEAGFIIYQHRPVKRKITLACKQKQEIMGKYIDMDLKQTRNKEARALYDNKTINKPEPC